MQAVGVQGKGTKARTAEQIKKRRKEEMITKEVLEEMKRKAHTEACCYAIDGLENEKLSVQEFGFRMGEFRGREDLLDELLALLDNANTIHSLV